MKFNKLPGISFRTMAIVASLFISLYFIFLFTIKDEWYRAVFTDIYFPLQKILAVIALLYAAQQFSIKQSKQAKSWYLWMAALACYAIGDTIWLVTEIFLKQEPFPSIADFFYLMYYPLMWLGLHNFPADKPHEGERKYLYLDNFIVVIGSGLVMYILTIAPTINSDTSDLLSYGISVLYPVSGMVVLWGVLIFFRSRMQQSGYLPILLLGLGLVGEIASDTLFAISYENYSSGSWIDFGWVIGSIFISLAAVLHTLNQPEKDGLISITKNTAWLDRFKNWPIYMPYLWAILAFLILGANLPIKGENFYLVVGGGILISLVVFRQVITINENEQLFKKAQQEITERKLAQEALHNANLILDQRVQERTQDLQVANQQLNETNTVLVSEICERKQTEKLLQRRVKIEELIAIISSSFINLPVNEIDQEIERALKLLGEFVEADRCYIFLFSNDKSNFSNTYEWCRFGITPQKTNLQRIPANNLPWWIEKLNAHEVISISNVAEMPTEARAVQGVLENQNIQSIIVVPLEWDKSLVGFFGFDAVTQMRTWQDEETTILKIVGEILITAVQRKVTQEALSNFSMRLKILHEIDQAILTEQPDENIISFVLNSMFELLPCRGSSLVTLDNNKRKAVLYFSKGQQDLSSFSIHKDENPMALGEIIGALDSMAGSGSLQDHQIPKIIFENMFRTSALSLEDSFLIAIPISDQECSNGFLCVRLVTDKDQSQDEIERIREVVHSLAIALNQAQLRQELHRRLIWMETSLHEKEILLKEIHHRVKNNLQLISSLLNLQTQVVQDPTARSALQDSQARVRSMALIHEKLYQSDNLAKIALSRYITNLSNNLFQSYKYTNGRIKLLIKADETEAGIDNAVPIGLILNELILNSIKHAFPGDLEGVIGIELYRENERFIFLRYYDTGVGLPVEFDLQNSKSLGMRLIFNLANQLNAKVELNKRAGVEFIFRWPIDPQDSSPLVFKQVEGKGII